MNNMNYLDYMDQGGTFLYKDNFNGEVYEYIDPSQTLTGSLLRAIQYAHQNKTPLFKMRKVTTNGVYDPDYVSSAPDAFSHTYSPLGYLRYFRYLSNPSGRDNSGDVQVSQDLQRMDNTKSDKH